MKPGKLIPLYFILFALLSKVYPDTSVHEIQISGSKSRVEISDIINPDKKNYNETDVRKICASITARYHSLGFTAFSIREAVLKSDGSISLVFSEPEVAEIIVTGAGPDTDDISESLYKKGEVFNEFTFMNNIRMVKERFSIRKFKISYERNQDDNLIITAEAERKLLKGFFSLNSDTIYGAEINCSVTAELSSSFFTALFETSSVSEKAAYTGAGFQYLNFSMGRNKAFISEIDYRQSDDYLDPTGESLYYSELYNVQAGVKLYSGPWDISLSLMSCYGDFQYFKEGFTFTGVSTELNYSDKDYRLDPMDVTIFRLNTDLGWNSLEGDPSVKIKTTGNTSLPVSGIISLSLKVNAFYTSENLPIYHDYIFNKDFPCRKGDYSSGSMRIIPGAGMIIRLYGQILFISPEYIHAVYKSGSRIEHLHAVKAGIYLNTEKFNSEFSYTIEMGEKINKGRIGFAAAGYF